MVLIASACDQLRNTLLGKSVDTVVKVNADGHPTRHLTSGHLQLPHHARVIQSLEVVAVVRGG